MSRHLIMNSAIQTTSPTGNYAVEVSEREMRMSLWVSTPVIRDCRSGLVVLTFRDTFWSLDAARWLDAERVSLEVRKFPGNREPPGMTVVVDCARKVANSGQADPHRSSEMIREVALSELEAEMDRILRARPLAKSGLIPG